MARIARVGDDVAVQLGVWEKIAGLHGDFRFPVSAITAVEGAEHEGSRAPAARRQAGLDVVEPYFFRRWVQNEFGASGVRCCDALGPFEEDFDTAQAAFADRYSRWLVRSSDRPPSVD